MKEITTLEELFNYFPAYRTASNGKMLYFRIGKGLAYRKPWADYVDENGTRVFLKDKFYPTLEEALKALYDEIQLTIPKK